MNFLPVFSLSFKKKKRKETKWGLGDMYVSVSLSTHRYLTGVSPRPRLQRGAFGDCVDSPR